MILKLKLANLTFYFTTTYPCVCILIGLKALSESNKWNTDETFHTKSSILQPRIAQQTQIQFQNANLTELIG